MRKGLFSMLFLWMTYSAVAQNDSTIFQEVDQAAFEVKKVLNEAGVEMLQDVNEMFEGMDEALSPKDSSSSEPKQDISEDSLKSQIFQFTVVPPLSTFGPHADNYKYKLSMNLFAGYTGAVDGVELGCFLNAVKHDVRGAQLSGFGNMVGGEMLGTQMAGFYNINRGRVKGAQFAGFVNITADSVEGGQFAGFTNVSLGGFKGTQLAGFSNTVHGGLRGFQGSGFVNTVSGDVEGSQIAGFANITAGHVKGWQMSGFVNVASSVRGGQLGFINVTDSIEKGVAIGFLSFVRNGYIALEVGANESLQSGISFKTGTHAFYNVISVSAGLARGGGFNWAYGYGVGTRLAHGERLGWWLELKTAQVNDHRLWNHQRLNLMNRLETTLSYDLSDRLSFYGGASLNASVSDLQTSEGTFGDPNYIPMKIGTYDAGGIRTILYPGATVGIRIRY